MILHGRNLIISADGKVIAGAKSCDINLQCSTIPVSSPANGQWEYSLPDMKSWSVTTNHLLMTGTVPSYVAEAVSSCHKDGKGADISYYNFDGHHEATITRGLHMVVYYWYVGSTTPNGAWVKSFERTYDTYESMDNCEEMVSDMTNHVNAGNLVIIFAYDAYGMNQTLASAISTKLGIASADIPVVNPARRASFCCIGVGGDKGVAQCNTSEGSTVHANLFLSSARVAVTSTPLKNTLQKAGTVLTLQMQTEGFAYDRLSGSAICTTARVTGTQGNLSQGSFSFLGSGPLE